MSELPTIDDIGKAALGLEGRIVRTPMLRSRTLGEITGSEIWLKFENLQYTASFKERGASNKLATLSDEERARGVIAMSAGNHAQGVAYHARSRNIAATVVMPEGTPFVKIDNTERLGAEVVLHGETVDDAANHAHRLAEKRGLVFIHPFDDRHVMAGQGTVALEMLEDVPELDVLVVPVGGGGLIGGMATAAKHLRPDIEIIGVEAERFPSVRRLLDGEPASAGGTTIADGIAVKRPGRLGLEVIRALVSDVLLVNEALLERAILDLLEIEKSVVEGAGAAGLAAVLGSPERFAGRKVGLVLSGGNIDSRLLGAVVVRGLVRTGRLVRYAVAVPDNPGSLARVTDVIAKAGGNVVDVAHHRAFSGRSVREAVVDFTLETRNEAHAAKVAETLGHGGFTVVQRKHIDD